MNAKLVNRGETGELIIDGRLDSTNADSLSELVESLVPRFDKLIINLEQLEYTSSAGLRIFLKVYKSMNAKGGELYLKDVRKSVMEVFEMTGLAGLLNFI